MKKFLFSLGFGFIGLLCIPFITLAEESDDFVLFPDTNLRNEISSDISKKLIGYEQSDFNYVFNKYNVIPKQKMELLEYVSPDFEDTPNLYGLEYAKNLKSLTGEFGKGFSDLSPIRNLVNLKEIILSYDDNTNLKDLQKLDSLEVVNINSKGFSSHEDSGTYTALALYDISDLSNLHNLKEINVQSRGLLQTITLKKGTTNFEMYSPVQTSTQFGNVKVEYDSNSKEISFNHENELLKWSNITDGSEYLNLTWKVNKGAFIFEGDSVIPINWID